MKPFIENAEQGGMFVLPFQVEGVSVDQIGATLRGATILAYGLPNAHSLKEAWLFRLVLDSGWTVDFSSACTGVGGWQEMGSLNLVFARVTENEALLQWTMTPIVEFHVRMAERLVFRSDAIYADVGIVLTSSTDDEVIISAGIPPGSVSIAAPFSSEEFRPENDMTALTRHVL